MRNVLKKIALALFFLFAVIQFITPTRNKSDEILKIDITSIYNVPENVQTVVKISCYDCHSNNTVYPWYSNIQPVGWLLAKDIMHVVLCNHRIKANKLN